MRSSRPAATLIATIAALSSIGCLVRERRIAPSPDTELAFAHAESTYYRGAHDSARAELATLLARAEASGDSATIGRRADSPRGGGVAAGRLPADAPTRAACARDEAPYRGLSSLSTTRSGFPRTTRVATPRRSQWLEKATAAARAMHDSLNAAQSGDESRARGYWSSATTPARAKIL
jgi:hypothetical protein